MTSTTAQRDENLAKATRIRVANHRTYRTIAALPPGEGMCAVADILRSPVGAQCSMRVGALLGAIRVIGPMKIGRLMALIEPCPQTKYVGKLTDRQRAVLADALDGWRGNGPRRHRWR